MLRNLKHFDVGSNQRGVVLGKSLPRALLLSCLALATASRFSLVDSRQLSVDEAESSINALTILERGYPSDRYLGLPIYENVLLTTTPNSEEYEFKDSSYSDRGMAVYHGWLPLYSIAAAFALADIHPDQDDGAPPTVRHGTQELTRRTVVPRIPSILFSVLFLGCAYQLGRAVSGEDTAWSMLIATAFAQPFVWFGWQARYYSATLAMTALAALAVWNLTARGRWRDSAAAGLALVLLFHTHSLSFVTMVALLLVNAPFGFNHRSYLPKLLLTGTAVGLALLPWMSWTGFLNAATTIPSAWPLLDFPHDYASWFTTRKLFIGIIGLATVLVLLSKAWPHQQLPRIIKTAATESRAFYFAAAWLVIAYLGFMFLIPAASFYIERLTLVLAIPGYLLLALSVAVASRTVTPRFTVVVAPLLVLALLVGRGTGLQFSRATPPNSMRAFAELTGSWRLEATTKLYAFPNSHLLLTYYLGLPVQSIAPVRKSFLDAYPGDIILLETGTPYLELPLTDVQTIGRKNGKVLSAEEAQTINLRVQRHGAREYLVGRVEQIWPPSEPLGPIELAVLERSRKQARQWGEQTAADFPLFRGFTPSLMTNSEWAPVDYWFVNPEKRIGEHLNYRERIRPGTGIVLPNGSVVFDARRNRDRPLVGREQYGALLHTASIPIP